MKKTLLMILMTGFLKITFGQSTVVVPSGSPGLTSAPGDNFTYLGFTVPHYGLGWYSPGVVPPKMFQSGYSGIRFFTNGAPRLDLSFTGDLGLGTVDPQKRLHIVGGDESMLFGNYENNNLTRSISFAGFRDVNTNYFGAEIQAVPDWICCGGYPAVGYPGIKNIGLNFNVHGNPDMPNDKYTALSIKSSGYVGIGTITPTERLAVNGKIRAREIKVEPDPATWPDYVFDEGYELTPLLLLEKYIKENKHLPEVPTAKEVGANGIELGEMNKLLLRKIEELTLLLIEQNKKLTAQGEEINEIKKKIKK